MDDRERMEQYLAWRRAEGKDRHARIRRRLRLTGALAAVTLVIALGIAIGGRQHRDTPDTRHARPNLTGEAPALEAADSPAPPTLSLSVREAPAPDTMAAGPAPTPTARRPRVRPSAAASRNRDLQPPPATARLGTSPPSDTSTYALASPPASRDLSAAPPGDTSTAARKVAATPATPTVIVEPPPVVIVDPPAAAPTPPVAASDPTVSTSSTQPAPAASPPSRIQRLKELTSYIPEVWLARKVGQWVQQQPPGELSPPPPERTQPQSR